ncbi:lipopolysaccharide assembly protein LapA domain-containing protein [Metabacillus sp. RGM 3146]|uniref:LapA family protein n=1 Tax=Metabacillus sp. RGM 3146 TaxID=3401092 RepID=UPI003B9A0DEC
MKRQWSIILTIVFALIVAIFAVNNVDSVKVNFLFGQTQWPLILIILGSVLMGGLLLGSTGMFRTYALKRRVKELEKENDALKIEAEKHRISEGAASSDERDPLLKEEREYPVEREIPAHEEPIGEREAYETEEPSEYKTRKSRMERHK